MVDLKSYPGDEIPGWTSYIYSEHRYREPHEYVNYWKWEEEACELEKELKLQKYTRCDLVKLISELDKDRKDVRDHLEGKVTEHLTELSDLHKSFDDLQRQYEESVHREENHKVYIEGISKTNDDLLKSLTSFGDHKPSCMYIEMVEAGRIPTHKEEEICTCGWSSVKKELID